MKKLLFLLIGCFAQSIGQSVINPQLLKNLESAITKSERVPFVMLHALDGEIVLYADTYMYKNSKLIQEGVLQCGSFHIPTLGVSFADLRSFCDYYETGHRISDVYRLPAFAKIHVTLRLPLR